MQSIDPSGVKLAYFPMILLVLFLAFGAGLVIRLALPRLKSSATSWFVMFGLMIVGLMFFGFLSLRVEHRVIHPPVEVVASMPQFVHPEPSLPPLDIPAPPAPVPAGESGKSSLLRESISKKSPKPPRAMRLALVRVRRKNLPQPPR